MKFSENWLRELVPVDADHDTLVARLTMSGLEVESVEPVGERIEDIVVAQILHCEPHPDADRLRVCEVDAGDGRLQIVCGAPNARAGLKAPLARVGSTLPGGLTIGSTRLRGVESNGMLCSSKELGISEEATGLMELPADTPVGARLTDVLHLPDARIELKLTPNRADCLGLRGLAFDVAAQFGSIAIEPPAPTIPPLLHDALQIRLQAGADCPRYCGRVIRRVDPTAPSPLWLTERLRRCGLRPVSAVVDVTSLVMLELGQPLHAFDRDTLEGEITVRRAGDRESLKLLDERTVELDREFLVIADDRAAVALAGVMGGYDTRVTDATRDVFLEAAHFSPAVVAGRARRLGMHTDAAHRFERGVDPELPRRAIERATELLLAITGGEPGPVTEAVLEDALPGRAPVALRRQRLARVLGLAVPDAEVERILGALGMQVESTADGWSVTPPSRRFDIGIEEDLIEEVVRVHGYEAVPTHAPSGELPLPVVTETRVSTDALRAQAAARGYSEALNYAFLAPELLRTWGLDEGAVALANPLSAEMAVMRTALLPGLVESLRRNLARQHTRVRLFELGHSFRMGSAGPEESQRIAAVAVGAAEPEQWSRAARGIDYFDIKGDLQSLIALTGQPQAFTFEPAADVAWLHPGRSARVLRAGEAIGWIGELHPRLVAALDLLAGPVAFEVDVGALAGRAVARAGRISRYPSVRRDLSLVVAETVAWADMAASLRAALGERLTDIAVFDRYTGPGLESGCKSLAIGLILQDVSRTLTDADADAAVATAVAALQREHGARLRG
ncbi:MAG TPA: phenylalanine--tRNA ligase subunit beta [Xanthomonadaceae bacterium]|nr:phenylalanine--tRNA ligase subunit beta [Xanthomonadaceae bacterium]